METRIELYNHILFIYKNQNNGLKSHGLKGRPQPICGSFSYTLESGNI